MAPIDTERVEAAVAEILAAIGEDVGRPGLESTPRRVAEAYAEFFSGLGVDPVSHLAHPVELADDERGELVLLRDIDFRSICEHHLLPFVGVAHVAYVPDRAVVGLGSLINVIGTVAARPQLQERLGEEIADAIEAGLSPKGVLVVLDSSHGCVTTRGPRQVRSTTVTLATRGILGDVAQRAEVLALIGGRAALSPSAKAGNE